MCVCVCGEAPHIRISVTSIVIQISTLPHSTWTYSIYIYIYTHAIYTHNATRIYRPRAHTQTHRVGIFAARNYVCAHAYKCTRLLVLCATPAVSQICDRAHPQLPLSAIPSTYIYEYIFSIEGWCPVYRSHSQPELQPHVPNMEPPNANRRRRIWSAAASIWFHVHVAVSFGCQRVAVCVRWRLWLGMGTDTREGFWATLTYQIIDSHL